MSKVDIKNKRAKFEYEFLDDFVAGIVLTGTEIKSIRNNKASITEAYCVFVKEELYIRNMHIAEYDKGSYNNHKPNRDRKLLLQRTELRKLQRKLKDQGLTIIASKLFISENNLAKLNIHLARGKKLHDKREDLKSKDTKRDLDRAMKRH
ncbi:SsrA-binding protein SmpB [Paracrocinitomix mangrovi]|uniref:SsrA-binding protein SmpB n=1 Tax=Paracrocinitomix mangrovi TaxID=2862509 RepID=UPI001C8E7722|nr:SsrA-binding protein SmpB [Paracrocinitomix mangrovi]UKN02963.1 SsrA-binding protein SmpB [Paracrocinitomix mangrovi]